MKKTALVYGASGMLGSHLAIDFARRGYEVIAISHNRNIVTDEVAKYAAMASVVTEAQLEKADITVDCGARPMRYMHDSLAHLPQYPQKKASNTVSFSSTVMFCEQSRLGVGICTEYVMDNYRRDHYTSTMENHILRLPVMTIAGHNLPEEVLIQSGRLGLDYCLLRADKDTPFVLTEHYLSVRDYVPVSELHDYVMNALKHPFSYVDSGSPRTLKEQVEYLIDHDIVKKGRSFLKNIQFTNTGKISNHYNRLDWCPNSYSVQ